MTPVAARCPGPDEILLWTSGQVTGAHGDAIEEHLAVCPDCGAYLDIALGISSWLAEKHAGEPGERRPSAEASHRVAAVPDPFRYRREAERLFAAGTETWASRLREHPHRLDADFLVEVADRAVWFANEEPEGVLLVVREARGCLDEQGCTGSDDGYRSARALLALAYGVALRTKGEHHAALAAYAEGETYTGIRAMSHEFARLSLAAAASHRQLGQLPEAAERLQMAGQVFHRCEDAAGVAKATWELANVLYQAGRQEQALEAVTRAHEGLLAIGEASQASCARLTLLGVLVALGRADEARRHVDALSRDENITGNRHQVARLRWLEGRLAVLEGRSDEAAGILEEAAEALVKAGTLQRAAGALIDLALVSGDLGDIDAQARAASRALLLLRAFAGQEAQIAMAADELRSAIASGSRLVEALVALRDQLRAGSA